jgi:hypothetical protein
MSYSSYKQERFDEELAKLVLLGWDAGVPWMSDALREMADKLDSRPAGRSLPAHLDAPDAPPPD